MAFTDREKDNIRDAFWEKLNDELVGALESLSCLSYSYCKDIADDVVNDINDDVLDSIIEEANGGSEDDTDPLPFLETIRSRYFHVLDAAEQRELEHLLFELRP